MINDLFFFKWTVLSEPLAGAGGWPRNGILKTKKRKFLHGSFHSFIFQVTPAHERDDMYFMFMYILWIITLSFINSFRQGVSMDGNWFNNYILQWTVFGTGRNFLHCIQRVQSVNYPWSGHTTSRIELDCSHACTLALGAHLPMTQLTLLRCGCSS